jgi:hypothetical protein
MQIAFNQMKALMTADVLCAYPNHIKPFHIFTDASDYQLGACIMQLGKPVAYYSKKLNSAQMNFTTIDKELLCVVATLREFRSMLLGAEQHIHTDHKYILNIGDSSQHRLCWISNVDEYGPELHYIEGPHNVITDTFSRLSRNDVSSPLVGKKAANVVSSSESDNKHDSSYLSLLDDRTIIDCLLNLSCISSNKRRKKRDVNCSKTSNLHYYSVEHCYLNMSHIQLGTVTRRLTMLKTYYWRIALPENLIVPTIKWYHQVTGHPGSKRLYRQLSQRYYHRDLRRIVDYLNCDFCQRNKLDGK